MPDKSDPPEWTKVSLPLPAKHQWKAKPGYKVFVGDAGVVRLEIPQDWVITHPKKDTIAFHDQHPPKDTARLSLSVFRLPPMPPDWWTSLPLEKMLLDAIAGAAKDAPPTGHPDSGDKPLTPMTKTYRANMEIGWLEKNVWLDPENGKPIRCRQCIARSKRTQILMTFDTYEEAGGRFDEFWNHLTKSMRLDAPVNLDGSGRN